MVMAVIQKIKNKLINFNFINNTALTIYLLVLAFLCFGTIGILNHEMWRDELQAWMIAKDSSSMIELLNNLRYEGHPGLWHSCLYLITRFTDNPVAMQFFHLLIATAVIYVFIKFSPFTNLQKILFSFGYFPFYEYSIISRNYNLGILFIFIFCVLYPKRKQGYLILSFIIFLLANTSVYGWIIAISLVMSLILDAGMSQNIISLFYSKKWNIIISLTLIILGIVIALFQLILPPDAGFPGEKIITTSPGIIATNTSSSFVTNPIIKRLSLAFITIWRSYIPIPNFFEYRFWNTNIFIENPSFLKNISGILGLFAFIFSLILILVSTAFFARKPVVLFLYLSGTCGIVLLCYIKYLGYLRHHGNLFILFLACLWISSFYGQSNFLNESLTKIVSFFYKRRTQYLTTILVIHVVAGVFAYTRDLNDPFSASKEVAAFIETQGFKEGLIIGRRDFASSPIAAFLNKEIYYPESDGFGSFIVWKKRPYLKSKYLLGKVNQALIKNNQNQALLILSSRLKTKSPDLSISELFQSSQSIVADETYYLYLVRRKPVNKSP
jgi:hypothetical protein